MIIDHELRAQALDRIARTPDGVVLYLMLQHTLMSGVDITESGALLVHQGERILASRIRAMMVKGIEESGGRKRAAGGNIDARPICFTSNQPVSVRAAQRGPGRRGIGSGPADAAGGNPGSGNPGSGG